MRAIKIGENAYELKSCLKECTAEDIAYIMTAQLVLKMKNTEQHVRVKLGILMQLSKISLQELEKLTTGQKLKLMGLVRWAYTVKVTAKPFEGFEVDGVTYLLAEERYSNTSSVEVCLLNIYYMAFTREKKPVTDMIYTMAATLCRPERKDLAEAMTKPESWTGDRREVYNSVMADERTAVFKAKAPMGIMIAVLQYWEVMNNGFVKKYEDIFKGGDAKQIFANGEGWLAMLEDVAESGVMGDLDKVYGQNANGLFMYILHKQKKLERQEELREKQMEK